MEPDESVALAILAATDAVWLPLRHWSPPEPANSYLARRDFAHQGVPWHSGEGSEAGRKESQRLVEGLAGQGRLDLFRPRGVKAISVRLTEEGDLWARDLCELPGVETALARLAEVVRMCARLGRVCVAEEALAGVAWGTPGSGKVYARVEDEVLPALVRGWLVSSATCFGQVYYHATAGGKRALAERPVQATAVGPCGAVVVRSERGKEAYGFYLLCLDAALARLRTAEPSDAREIGELPLPVSMGKEAVFLADVAAVGAVGGPGGPVSQVGEKLASGAQRGANGAPAGAAGEAGG